MYPPAYPHDPIKTLYPGVYLLHGSIKMGPGMRMNRNMIILQSGSEITLGNSEKDFLIWQNLSTPPAEPSDEADDLRRRRVRR